MTSGAGRGWWSAARRGADLSLAAAAGGERPLPPARGTSFVLLAAAMPAHPAWQELTELTAEIERERRNLAAERSAVASITQQAGASLQTGERVRQVMAAIGQAQKDGREEALRTLQSVYARRWEAERRRLEEEAERKVAARRAVLAARVDEQIGVKRGELKAALAARTEQIRREREARLLSLQLRLGLQDKDPAAAAREEALQEELRQVQAAIEQDIKAAQKDMEDQLAAYAREVEESAGRELRAYAAEMADEVARQVEAVRQALNEELVRRLQDLAGRSSTGAVQGSGAAAARRTGAQTDPGSRGPDSPTPLELRRNALQARIIADVRRVATLVAQRHGLGAPELVATAGERPADGLDLTAAVVDVLMR